MNMSPSHDAEDGSPTLNMGFRQECSVAFETPLAERLVLQKRGETGTPNTKDTSELVFRTLASWLPALRSAPPGQTPETSAVPQHRIWIVMYRAVGG